MRPKAGGSDRPWDDLTPAHRFKDGANAQSIHTRKQSGTAALC
jgi:hypothetical protein